MLPHMRATSYGMITAYDNAGVIVDQLDNVFTEL
ncbi:hypothetical protein QFZ80_002932 [Paenibacillus sp. V4I7]|nr:hypothetical protein [Paenibacillus sp. V4I7]